MRKLYFIFAFAVCIAMTMSVTAQKNLLKTLRDNIIFAKKGSVDSFPEAVRIDPKPEETILTEFKNSMSYNKERWDIAEILKLVIFEKDCTISRHELSGIVIDRYIRSANAVKRNDGKCGYLRLTFKQDFLGNTYEPVKFNGVSDLFVVECKSLE